MPDHLTDAQAADVLRRAALLQARSDHARGPRLSLDDLKQAAEAAGIEARYVEQAYLGAGDDLAPEAPFLGIETGVRRVRMLSAEVSEEEWGRIVLALRREFGNGGTVETFGNVREWTHGQTRIQLEPDGPRTRVTATSQWSGDAKVTSVAALGYGAVAAILAAFAYSGAASWVFAVLMAALAILHGAAAWGWVRRRAPQRGAALDRALDAMERLATTDERASGGPAALAPEAAPDASGARIDPGLLSGEPAAPEAAPERRRTRA